ncbi:MAG: metallophosphoesterase [Luteolibacter sp.]
MSIILIIVFSIPMLSLVWWIWAHRQLHRLGADACWKLAMAIGMITLLGGFLWTIANRMAWLEDPIPEKLNALILLWGLLFLPMMALPLMFGWMIVSLAKRALERAISRSATELKLPTQCSTNRRKLLGMLALLAPVAGTFGATAYGLRQLRHFRIRRITVELADLPEGLDGMIITHLTDTHVGKFCHGKFLRHLTEAVNDLKSDLTLFTGDLIDFQIDDLREGVEMMRGIKPRSGIFMVEGNHDIADDREGFYRQVRASGIPLLLNEAATIRVRGVPVQILGISWSRRDEGTDRNVDDVAALREDGAFPILLAHHPHAFDQAAKHGIPLTLAGHTHGGQLMVSKDIGAGPLLFRYWSGLYRKGRSALVVSNGAGNWFPLRVHAPAEIIHLTLKRASA